ncbi:MAG: FAD-dependent oxidoreductase [Candidatus Eisenbacteria bacterium]
MSDSGRYLIHEHPILTVPDTGTVEFTWAGKTLTARRGLPISSALFANGIRTFGHHHKDGSPQGIFCANGQCSQCSVLVGGRPAKSCMVLVEDGMKVEPLNGLPSLPSVAADRTAAHVPNTEMRDPEHRACDCLVIGGGPAGLSAAIEMGKAGVDVLLVDDKHMLGGKLVLQTHKFFGSMADCYAGMRGNEIGHLLADEVAKYENITVWTNTNAVAVFSDRKVGLVRDGKDYVLVEPKTLLVAAGAREKSLIFRGNSLPGVYGAGAFQTLVNRDLVRPAERLFIVGGGNVGLIAGYHALQAGIDVVGLIEALPECGGYKVHKDKLVRMGVPIHTSHTIVSANGKDGVESVTIARIGPDWKAIPGTELSFACDTVLVAVGLDPVDEFYHKAREFGMNAFSAGDAHEIAEASAAMFSGRIQGREIARALGCAVPDTPVEWAAKEEVLKSRPGNQGREFVPEKQEGVVPIFHCSQEIPCNPCISVCPIHGITTGDDIRHTPKFVGEAIGARCGGCGQCVSICPGLAITLVDYRKDAQNPVVTIAHEFGKEAVKPGDIVDVLDTMGGWLGRCEVLKVRPGVIKLPDGKDDAEEDADASAGADGADADGAAANAAGVGASDGGKGAAARTKDADAAASREVRAKAAPYLMQNAKQTYKLLLQAPRSIATQIAGIRVQKRTVTEPMDLYVERLTDDTVVCRCERVMAGEIRALIRAGCRDVNEIKTATRSGMGACGAKTCGGLIERIFAEEGVKREEVEKNVGRPFFVEIPLGVFCGVDPESSPGSEATLGAEPRAGMTSNVGVGATSNVDVDASNGSDAASGAEAEQ